MCLDKVGAKSPRPGVCAGIPGLDLIWPPIYDVMNDGAPVVWSSQYIPGHLSNILTLGMVPVHVMGKSTGLVADWRWRRDLGWDQNSDSGRVLGCISPGQTRSHNPSAAVLRGSLFSVVFACRQYCQTS